MKKVIFFSQVVLFLFVLSTLVYADESNSDKESFLNAIKPLQKIKSYEVQGGVILSVNPQEPSQKPQKIEHKFKIVSKGQDLTFLELDTNQGNIQFFRDGQKLTIYSEKDKGYFKRETPEGVKAFMLIGGPDLLDSILYGDADQIKSAEVKLVKETQDTAQKELHYQVKTEKGEALDLWFSMADEPKLVRVQKPIPTTGISSGGIKNFYFDNWKLNTQVDEKIFKFTPPDGVTEIENKPKKDNLLGQKAPAFTLPSLDGKQVSLEDFRGKQVVVLDFWATWCRYCIEAMPIIQKVSEELKDKDVVFFAVNLGEDKTTINSFMKKMNLKLPVLMDETRRTAELYDVKGIPRMVIIDKNGIVKGGHFGLLADLESLKKEILTILSEK
ncbi:MAG TPA: redoxin domain-containing protein [Candidatus Hydrogenedens sp.]|nr:redoxin domain-containing protein [Candidatus Hydrogenedens sp.]